MAPVKTLKLNILSRSIKLNRKGSIQRTTYSTKLCSKSHNIIIDILKFPYRKDQLIDKAILFLKQKKKQRELHIHFSNVRNTCRPAAVCVLSFPAGRLRVACHYKQPNILAVHVVSITRRRFFNQKKLRKRS